MAFHDSATMVTHDHGVGRHLVVLFDCQRINKNLSTFKTVDGGPA